MTESDYRLFLSVKCDDYARAVKKEAGQLVINRYMQMTLDEEDSVDEFFSDVIRIVSAYCLEIAAKANR